MDDLTLFLIAPKFEGWLNVVRLSFIGVSVIFLILLIYFFRNATWWRRRLSEDMAEFFSFKSAGVRKIEKMWEKIRARLDTGFESEYKLAVIEAEAILDDILNRMGFAGETLGERLKKITVAVLPNLYELQDAHRIRNNIVHDPDYRLTLDEAKKTLLVYEKALRDLDAF